MNWLFASGGQSIGTSTSVSILLQEGWRLPGPKSGLLSNTQKWIVQGDMCWPSKGLYWKGAPWQRAAGWGSPGECFATWLALSGFMVMGLISGLSLANCSDSESFLVAHSLLSQGGCQRGFWEVVGHVVSPFDLSWTLPVGGGLLFSCSLPGPPVVKQLVQIVTMVAGQGEQCQWVGFP